MAFCCTHCGYKDNEVKSTGEMSEKGKKIILKVEKIEDLERDLFKSESACVKIPELGLEMSTGTLGSFYTTVEGLLDKIYDNLS